VRIYLDTSVYSRPFDDQSQDRVRQEAEAFVEILAAVVVGRLICLNSDILRLEVRRNPSTAERERIEDFLTLCAEAVAESAEVFYLAQELQ
jgi:predicted nucleic acid-binding protein